MDLSCHVLLPPHPPLIKVIQWKSKTEFIEHVFDEQTDFLYTDDTIYITLLKILGILKITTEKRAPYLWHKDPLRFKLLKNNWENYHINPTQTNLSDKPPLPEIQQLSDRILNTKEIHFITYSDFLTLNPSSQVTKYYFPNEKDTVSPSEIQSALYQNKLLNQLWNVPAMAHKAMIQQSSCSYTRAFFQASLPPTEKTYKELFDKFHTSELIPFVQFYDDMNHIYYKVHQKHSIPVTLFNDWTNIDLLKNQHSLTFYSFMKASYMKIYFDDSKKVQIQFYFDTNESIRFDSIQDHLRKVMNLINKQFGMKIKPTIDRLALKTSIYVPGVNFKDLATYFAKLLPIFNVPSKNRVQKNILDLQYKRVAKYGQSLDIVDFIKSKIQLDVPLKDIIDELADYGIDEMSVRDYYEQIQRENDLPKEKKLKRNFKNLGLLMHISPVALGLQIYIDNASSFNEMQKALFWTRSAVYQSMHVDKKTLKEIIPVVEAPVFEEEEEQKPIIPIPRETPSTTSSTSSSLSLGGAIGKQHQRFFKNMLEKIDPDIFAKSENYARMCQISDLRQPVGMTKEQKQKIDAMGYSDGYDNFLEYGSDPTKKHVYMCPKIYCPTSQIPLSYEKYKELGDKCPDPDEEPILLYTTSSWYNDPARKHYVGFLKEKGYNNLNLPCCFKTPQDKKLKKVITEEKPQEDSYIIDKIKQLEVNRYGTIPSSLHNFLYPNVPYNLCRNTVKASECLLRRGITQSSDSLMESIAYLLDFSNKQDLMIHIAKALDPFTFLTLENGHVYTYFITKPKKASLKNLKAWYTKFPEYVKLFHLEDTIPYLNKSLEEAPLPVQYKLARQLQLYESYYNFMRYLKDDEPKNPYLLFDLVHHLGAILVVWNRDSQNIATLRCPFVTKNKKWFNGIPYILVMQQETYYEPLIIVDPDKNITQKISFTQFDQLMKLIQKCPTMMYHEDQMIQKLYTLSLWIDNILEFSKDYHIKDLVLDPQDKIIGIFLKNHLFIQLPTPLSLYSIHSVIDKLRVKSILYWEDIQHKTFDVTMYRADLRLLQRKLKNLNFGFHAGTIKSEDEDKITYLYTVPQVRYPEPPKLPIVLTDTFIQTGDMITQDTERWRKTKKSMLKKLIKEYPSIVKPILKKSKLDQLKSLRDHFTYLQQPSRTAVLLEELPYQSKELLEKQYKKLRLEKPYFYKDDKVFEDSRKKEWVFSQKLIYKDIDYIKFPTRIQRPIGDPKVQDEVLLNVQLDKHIVIPEMLDTGKLEKKALPSKWRSKFWLNYKIGYLPNYNKKTFYDFFTWYAQKNSIDFDQTDIKMFLRKQVYLLLEDPKNYELLLEDVSMRKAWNEILQRNYRSVKEIIDLGFSNKTIEELQEKWIQIISNDSLWIQDLDLYNISKLLSISFFIIQKGKDVQETRGNIDELVYASKFISDVKWKNHPVLVLFKQPSDDKSHMIYSVIISDTSNGYYEKGSLLPSEIKEIIGKHSS